MPTQKGGTVTNKKELRAAMIRKGFTTTTLAERIGISRQSLSKKMNNHREFRISEAEQIAQILGLTLKEKTNIFFKA